MPFDHSRTPHLTVRRVVRTALAAGGAMVLAGMSFAGVGIDHPGGNAAAVARPPQSVDPSPQRLAQADKAGNPWGERQACSASQPAGGKTPGAGCNPCAAKSARDAGNACHPCSGAENRRNSTRSDN